MSEAGSDSAQPKPRRQRGLTEKLGAIVLGFEAIVVGLGGLTIFGLKRLPDGVEQWWAIVGGAAVAIAMLLVAGRLATKSGIVLGWVLQGIVALSAFLVPAMLAVAVVFGGMWAYALIAGKRAEQVNPYRE